MHVGAAGEHVDAVAGLQQLGRERAGALDGATLALGKQLTGGDLEGHSLGGDCVLERAALLAGEDGRIDLLGELLLAEDHAGARAAEGLVRGRGDDVSVLDRTRMQPCCHESGEVGHVDHQQRADFIRDLPEAREVEPARIRRPAGEQHLWAALARDARDLVHVDQAGGAIDLVGGDLVQAA